MITTGRMLRLARLSAYLRPLTSHGQSSNTTNQFGFDNNGLLQTIVQIRVGAPRSRCLGAPAPSINEGRFVVIPTTAWMSSTRLVLASACPHHLPSESTTLTRSISPSTPSLGSGKSLKRLRVSPVTRGFSY